MIYVVQMQTDIDVWTSIIPPNDIVYEYNNELDALAKAAELQSTDPSGRKYRVITQ